MQRVTCLLLLAALGCQGPQSGSSPRTTDTSPARVGNDPERVEWFQGLALGMFIHWSFDSQLGAVISHSMVGASPEYLDRFIHELPRTFEPCHFEPGEWARLARLAGVKYVVFTTKHHSGFCMFRTETTPFNVLNTPYGRDVTREIVDAFRQEGLHVGFYFSPDDFWILHRQGHDVSRRRPEADPRNNQELMLHNKRQLEELLRGYGPIDFLFIDGQPAGLKELAWRLQPDLLVTRGEMETPEQRMPDQPLPGPWEACFTLGTQWSFKPTHEEYKSGTRLIEMLIEIRARGGNLLLNVGPTPDGEIPFEQERRMRELALWLFVNGEAIYDVRPWHVSREGPVWFTRSRSGDTVYAFVTGDPWPLGERRTITLESVRATEETEIGILGQSGRVLEYRPDVDPGTTWTQDDKGLHLSALRAQRLYNNRKWPNPVVLKITHAEPVRG